MRELFCLSFERFLGPDQLFIGTLAGQQYALGVLDRDAAQQLVFPFGLHYATPRTCAASAVPFTRARIFANAVSRLVEVSSQNGENPQSSVVPS